MSVSQADVAMIDVFEKIKAYLLERDPGLESGALARPASDDAWLHRPRSEYREILLGVLLGIDRRTAAGRRAVRRHLQDVVKWLEAPEQWRVSEGDGDGDLYRRSSRERWLRAHLDAIGEALAAIEEPDAPASVSEASPDGPPVLFQELRSFKVRREALRHLRKNIRILSAMRQHEFLARIGYPTVIPDPAHKRLFHRLGWIPSLEPPGRYPQLFFEACERLVHLTGEAWPVVNAVTGLFAGSRTERAATDESLAVCKVRPLCGQCVAREQCPYFRYAGEPQTKARGPSRSVKNMAYAEQPRTRFETAGPGSLSEAELLALIVRTGAEGKSSLDLAREILERFGSLQGVAQAGMGELRTIKGVGRAKAIEIQAALELGRRLGGSPVAIGESIRRSGDIYRLYGRRLENEEQENFYLLVLNTRNRIHKDFLISRGSLSSSPVHPREVMKAAIREAASAVVFLHNHPSGDPEPSEDDREITRRLVEAAKLVSIRVLDHVIVGRDNYFSFADHGLI